jgi:peptidoglycan biosynthesis protein MviN/MurJ (putative lipid II flippase)
VHILVRVFFSFQDTKTPVIASLISMGVNIAFSFFFVWLLSFDNFFRSLLASSLKLTAITNIEVIAFPLAILLSTVLQLFLLVYFLQKKTGEFRGLGIKKCLERTIFASSIMGVATFFVMQIVGTTLKLETFYAVFVQFSLASITALVVYILVLIMIKSPELFGIIGDLFKKEKTEEQV